MSQTRRYPFVRITRVRDGDTVVADIDCGFHGWQHDEVFRLDDIQAPPLNEPDGSGERSKARLEELVLGKLVAVTTVKNCRGHDKKGKYGRYLATIHADSDGIIENVNQRMMREGHATAYK